MPFEREVYDARREELEAEFFAGSNDERYSALDAMTELATYDESLLNPNFKPIPRLPVIQPEAPYCPECVPF